MQGNLVLFKMNRVWNGLCSWRNSRVWKKILRRGLKSTVSTGIFACIWDKAFSICVIFDIILFGDSWKVGVADKVWGTICVISACCWFTAILETGTVRKIGAAVFWSWTCSVIVAKEVSTRLLVSLLGTDVIGGNFKLIHLVLFCSTEVISEQICKKS